MERGLPVRAFSFVPLRVSNRKTPGTALVRNL